MCTYLCGNAWSNVPCEKIGMYEKIFCCYKFLQPLVLEIFLWAMEKVCPEVLYEKKWSRASLSTTFFHTRLLEKLFPLPTKRFLTLGCKNYSNKIQLFSFYYSKWDCSKFLFVNILSINIHSLQNLALRICDKAAALIWFFCRYPLYRNPSFMIILWSQLFLQQKDTLLWKSMLAF